MARLTGKVSLWKIAPLCICICKFDLVLHAFLLTGGQGQVYIQTVDKDFLQLGS